MKKVLIISHEFAPSAYVGAKRMIKFAKFLPQFGWMPIILTKEIHRYHNIDVTLNKDIRPDVRIYRIKEWGFTNDGRDTKNSDSLSSGKSKKNMFLNQYKKLLLKILSPYLFFDYQWLFPAFFAGLRIIKKERINIIFASYPWPESLIIGLLLKIFTGKRLVSDFRDPWTDVLFLNNSFPAKIESLLHCFFEKMTLRKSDHVVVVGEILEKRMIDIAGDNIVNKFSVIYNGYDEDDFLKKIGHEKIEKDIFNITYLGTWRPFISPIPFLKAVGVLLRRNSEIRERIRINFIGDTQGDIRLQREIENTIEQEKIEKVIRVLSFESHQEGLGHILSSDALLLVIGFIPEQPLVFNYRVPAKLFEYLYAGKQILALVPPNGEAARIIIEANAGVIVHPLDVEGIANKIEEMYKPYKTGTLNVNQKNNTIISRFDRKRQAQQLTAVFQSLLQ